MKNTPLTYVPPVSTILLNSIGNKRLAMKAFPISIDCQAFNDLTSSLGANNLMIRDDKSKVMDGHFFHHELGSGLDMHGADVIELSDAISSTEIPASLSLNILLKGKVNFCLGGKSYQLNTDNIAKKSKQEAAKGDITVTCAVSVLAKSDLFSRKMSQGQAVKKVNLFIKRSWLEKRCTDTASKALLNKLFSNHCALYQWQDNAAFSDLAQQLLSLPNEPSLQTDLLKEQIGFALLNNLLAIIATKIDSPLSPVAESQLSFLKSEQRQLQKKDKIEQFIAKELENIITLASLAKHFGLSVSSLQRYFKQTYKQTVNEYIREQRLEKAKIAITVKEFTIGEAGFQAGYNHVSNFTSAFKKHFGITPANLLKLHKFTIN